MNRTEGVQGVSSAFAQRKSMVVRGIQALGGEAIQGVAHYVLTLMLVANVSPHSYAIYAGVIALAGVSVSYLNALAATSMQVHVPQLSPAEALRLRSSLVLVGLIFSGAVGISAATAFFWTGLAPLLAVPAALVIALWPLRVFVKATSFAHNRADVALGIDAIYGAVMLVAIGVSAYSDGAVMIFALWTMVAANFAAIFAGAASLRHRVPVRLSCASVGSYLELLHEVAWTVLGNTATTVQAYAYAAIFATGAGAGRVGAFAALSASLAIFGPIRLAVGAWQNATRSELAKPDGITIRHFAQLSTCLVLAASLTLSGIMYLAWPRLTRDIFGAYADYPMAAITSAWLAVSCLYALRGIPSVVLQAQRRFRRITCSVSAAAAASLTLTLMLSLYPEVPLIAFPLAALAGEAICAIDQWLVVRSLIQAERRGLRSLHPLANA